MADGHAAEQHLVVGGPDEFGNGTGPHGPGLLGTGGEPRLHRQQHEGLEEHPEVGPLGSAHPAVDETEERSRRAEELIVLRQPGQSGRLVVPGDPQQFVHLLADGESVGPVRFPQIGRVDRIAGLLDLPSANEVEETGHGTGTDHVDPPRLHVAARWRSGGLLEQIDDQLIVDRRIEERPDRLPGRNRIADVHRASLSIRRPAGPTSIRVACGPTSIRVAPTGRRPFASACRADVHSCCPAGATFGRDRRSLVG